MIALWADNNTWATLKVITNQVINLINSMTNTTIPVGGILPYYGNINDATLFDVGGVGMINTTMEKFALCVGQGLAGSLLKNFDGTPRSITPDLRDRFLIGQAPGLAVGAIGGEAAVTLTAAQSGLREHGHIGDSSTSFKASVAAGGSDVMVKGLGSPVISVDGIAGRDGAQNALESHNNMPPYVVVAYIIRYK